MNYASDVRTFVVNNFLYGDATFLKDNTSFLDGGILDSTGMLELVTFLETTYHITIETMELLPSNLDSVNKVSQFLSRKLEGCPEARTPSVSEYPAATSQLFAPDPFLEDYET